MRKTIFTLTAVVAACMLTLFACRKNVKSDATSIVSDEVLTKIYNLGFSNKDVFADGGDYIVEGDIRISQTDLNEKADVSLLRVAGEEQYRTTNLVTGLPRNITVSLASALSTWSTALNTCISRYNALGLRITFTRVSSGGNIQIVSGTGSFLASSGFPSGGNPYNRVILNASAVAGQPNNTVASILAHEIGHCIGFRHTDYFNRAYSCGGSAVNEGSAGVGAINIPGTPTAADPNSWMLSCIGSGQNRPFNANDITALNYLY
ncbi:protease [Niastella yeongjuensis]|uniref:Protease n=1 Tax=Niastella yeongjuensis TaxID=354355 RepID=A0A1V9F0I0_9BACT|nr:M57 family metalloprotease [Niastella yeongjuensis]OQP51754.1 protease [Niastella yeongjuensis]SEP48779.1 Dual-action HEIGH metallo-peptidase [Niastella yeongjuensis]